MPANTNPVSLRLSTAPVSESVRISVENELLGHATGNLRPFLLSEGPRLPRPLRGRSWDRMEALGETFFEVSLKPRLRAPGVAHVKRALSEGKTVVLESRALDHVLRPLARHLGVDRFVARRLEYRDGIATGRVFRDPEPQSVMPHPLPHAVLRDTGVSFTAPERLSVREALRGKHLLLLGGSGFIGKVWLASLLRDVPDVARITVILRPKGGASADARLHEMLQASPVFEGLDNLEGSGRIDAVEGDVTRARLGLTDEAFASLTESVDLVVSCAGLTEFNPDLRDALAVNVEGMIHLLDFTRDCASAALLHVSTCFVAGKREGRVREELHAFETPNGLPLDPEKERAALHATIAELGEKAVTEDGRRRPIRRAAIEAGLRRAEALGWPNIYTFTKALGEGLIATRGADLAVATVRPSIVETSTHFPWPGWNEGINTSAPLSYLLGTPFRQLPVNERKCLDVIPVDTVCRGMTLVAAALARRVHPEVTQLATSESNPLPLGRAVELTALAHRKHYRQIPQVKHRLLERLEAIPVSRERYQRLSVPLQLRVVRAVNRIVSSLPGGRRPLLRAEKSLRRVQDLIDLYEPFLLDNEPVFEAVHAELLSAALPEEERETFAVDVRNLDWYDYWVNVHIPALRKWSYPLIEGRQPPVTRPAARRAEVGAASTRAVPVPRKEGEGAWPRS
ncbi:SDR family oxidoreductase [bacterium]|nr:SDR family oxidoreductase [bacterium]